jgi:fructose/tagatose bisphosphate aldolase
MPLVPYTTLAAHAERNAYALGYFECWDLASLLAVLSAAEEAESPVIVGFNGAYIPEMCGRDLRRLHAYGAAGREAVSRCRAPAAFIFNESPFMDWVEAALDCGFNAVMYTDESLPVEERIGRIAALVKNAHARGVAVEAELGEPPGAPQARGGVGGAHAPQTDTSRTDPPRTDPPKTDPGEAARFVRETGIDALGVLVGNRHDTGSEPAGASGAASARADSHATGRNGTTLDLALIARLKEKIQVPLVLHAGSGVAPDSLRAGIRAGIRRVNIGRAVKEPAYHSIRRRVLRSGERYPGYEALGSGLATDILGGVEGAILHAVREKLSLFGIAGMADAVGSGNERNDRYGR